MASLPFFAQVPDLPDTVCRQAAQWLVELQADPVAPGVEARWRAWRAADPLHERAWQRVEACLQDLDSLPPRVAAGALSALPAPGRRRAAKVLALLALGAGSGAAVMQAPAGRRWRADHHTDTAQQRRLRLADDSLVTLDAGSAMDVLYTDAERRLRLVEGGIFIESASDPLAGPGRAARPLEVLTKQGLVRAGEGGTRFSVRQLRGSTLACVFNGAVELCPAAAAAALPLRAGQQAYFDNAGLRRSQALSQRAPGWMQGMLVADDMRLGDFLDMLAAYHRGGLSWSSQVEGLRISGTYPLADTDAVLRAVQALLPVAVRDYAGLWTRVGPRQA